MMLLENEVSLDPALISSSRINQTLLYVTALPTTSTNLQCVCRRQTSVVISEKNKVNQTKVHSLFLLKEYLLYFCWLVS